MCSSTKRNINHILLNTINFIRSLRFIMFVSRNYVIVLLNIVWFKRILWKIHLTSVRRTVVCLKLILHDIQFRAIERDRRSDKARIFLSSRHAPVNKSYKLQNHILFVFSYLDDELVIISVQTKQFVDWPSFVSQTSFGIYYLSRCLALGHC